MDAQKSLDGIDSLIIGYNGASSLVLQSRWVKDRDVLKDRKFLISKKRSVATRKFYDTCFSSRENVAFR